MKLDERNPIFFGIPPFLFPMADVAMVTKVQKLLNLFQTSRNFTVMFLVICRFANRDINFQNGCS
jgi:hypothetical protein